MGECSSRLLKVPSLIWRSNRDVEIALELSSFLSFPFFGFFGFTDEGRKNYRFALQSVVKRVGILDHSEVVSRAPISWEPMGVYHFHYLECFSHYYFVYPD